MVPQHLYTGKSGNSPQGYSKDVTIEGHPVAIQGATFKSMGDVASQGSGGGLISSNVEGPTSFVGPGSLDAGGLAARFEAELIKVGGAYVCDCEPEVTLARRLTLVVPLARAGGMALPTLRGAAGRRAPRQRDADVLLHLHPVLRRRRRRGGRH